MAVFSSLFLRVTVASRHIDNQNFKSGGIHVAIRKPATLIQNILYLPVREMGHTNEKKNVTEIFHFWAIIKPLKAKCIFSEKTISCQKQFSRISGTKLLRKESWFPMWNSSESLEGSGQTLAVIHRLV